VQTPIRIIVSTLVTRGVDLADLLPEWRTRAGGLDLRNARRNTIENGNEPPTWPDISHAREAHRPQHRVMNWSLAGM